MAQPGYLVISSLDMSSTPDEVFQGMEWRKNKQVSMKNERMALLKSIYCLFSLSFLLMFGQEDLVLSDCVLAPNKKVDMFVLL